MSEETYNLNQEAKNRSLVMKLIHLVRINQLEWQGQNLRFKPTPMIWKCKFLNSKVSLTLKNFLIAVERVFEYKDVPEDNKVNLVALRLRKSASLWWTNLSAIRARERKSRILTWEKMKSKDKHECWRIHTWVWEAFNLVWYPRTRRANHIQILGRTWY